MASVPPPAAPVPAPAGGGGREGTWYERLPEDVAAHFPRAPVRRTDCGATPHGQRGLMRARWDRGWGTQGAGPAAAVAAFVAAATGESGRPEDVYATRVRDKWLPLDNPDRRKSARTQTRRKVPFKMNADERRRLRAGDIPADKRTYAACAARAGREIEGAGLKAGGGIRRAGD